MSTKPGVVARVGRWCVEHRRRALIAWVVLLVVALGASSAVGARQANQFSLNGTESQRAQDLLTRSFPAQSGDIDQVVFHARQGRITTRPSAPGSPRP
jgi:RND superfamily putative drug exporter